MLACRLSKVAQGLSHSPRLLPSQRLRDPATVMGIVRRCQRSLSDRLRHARLLRRPSHPGPPVEAVVPTAVRPVTHPGWRRPWWRWRSAVLIHRPYDPAGGPPVLTPFSVRGAPERFRPISDASACLASSRVAMTAVVIRCASASSVLNGRLAARLARTILGLGPRKGTDLPALQRRRSASLSALSLSQSPLSCGDRLSR